MKPINLQTIILPVIGWIRDFQKDNSRLPDSLDDLIANKSPNRDYNPARSITRNQKEGYTFVYNTKPGGGFEVKISKDNESAVYDKSTDTLSFFEGGQLQHKVVLN